MGADPAILRLKQCVEPKYSLLEMTDLFGIKLYRAENFTASAGLYDELSSADPALEQSDLRINRGAVEAQLMWSGQRATAGFRKPGREDLEAFELAYNAACASIARGELRQAEVLLKRAKGAPASYKGKSY